MNFLFFLFIELPGLEITKKPVVCIEIFLFAKISVKISREQIRHLFLKEKKIFLDFY